MIVFSFPVFFSIAICDYIWIEKAAGENFTKLLILRSPKSLIFFFAGQWSSVIKAIITLTYYFFELAVN